MHRAGHLSLGAASPAEFDIEALVSPARHATDHLFHRATQRRNPQGAPIRSIAVRTGAIDDEERIVRIRIEPHLRQLGIRQAHRARDVPLFVAFRRPHVDEDDIARFVLPGRAWSTFLGDSPLC